MTRLLCCLMGHVHPGYARLQERDFEDATYHWVRCLRCAEMVVTGPYIGER